jgi:hypothetical protein
MSLFKNKKTIVFFVSAIMLAASFFPQLFMGRAFSNGDALWTFYPEFAFYKNQLIHHVSFLWTNGILSGFPIYLDLSGGFFSPLNMVLFKYLSIFTAYNIAIFCGIALMFLFTYLFARSISLSRPASLITAIAFSFGYHNSNWSNNLPVVNALFTLPMLLFVLTKIRQGKLAYTLLGIAGITYSLISCQPQWVLLAIIGAGLYALYLTTEAAGKWDLRNLAANYKVLLALVLMAGLGAAIASFQLIPSQKFTAISARSAGLSFNDAMVSAQTPVDWVWYVLPEFQLPRINTSEPTLYVGILPLFFAIIAVFGNTIKSRRIRFFAYFFLFGLVGALWYSPIFWLIHNLPVLKYFRGSNRMMYIGNLGLSVLAGYGLDLLLQRGLKDSVYALGLKILGYLALVVGIVVAVGNLIYLFLKDHILNVLFRYFDTYYYPHTTHLPIEHYHNVIKTMLNNVFANIGFGNIKFLVPFMALIGGYMLLRRFPYGRATSQNSFIAIAVAFVFLNLAAIHPNFYQILPTEALATKPDVAEYLSKNNGDFRAFSLFSGISEFEKLDTAHWDTANAKDIIEFQKNDVVANLNMLYGFNSPDGYNNLMPYRNAKILALLGSQRATAGDSLAYNPEGMSEKLNSVVERLPLFSMLNVKYLISAYELPATDKLELVHTTKATRFEIPIFVYENKNALPELYLAENPVFIPENNETSSYTAVTRDKNDFSKQTFIECGSSCPEGEVAPNDSISIEKDSDGFVALKADIDKGRWVIFSQSNVPGWKIALDGNPARSYMANYLFHAVYIPSGTHEVVFEYKGI